MQNGNRMDISSSMGRQKTRETGLSRVKARAGIYRVYGFRADLGRAQRACVEEKESNGATDLPNPFPFLSISASSGSEHETYKILGWMVKHARARDLDELFALLCLYQFWC
jgi:hypothetical protein